MLSPITKEFDTLKVTYVPMPIMDASALDSRVLALVLPLIGTFKDMLGPDVDLSKLDIDLMLLSSTMAKVLSGLTRDAQNQLVVDSLKGCTVLKEGQAPVEITSTDAVNRAFQGCELATLYRAIFESWRFNKLLPFVLAERFGMKFPTDTGSGEPSVQPKSGLKLGR